MEKLSQTFNYKRITPHWMLMLVAVALIGLLIIPGSKAQAVKSVCDFQHRECFTEADYPACFKKIDIEKYYEFTEKKQDELAAILLEDEKRCIILSGNQKAFLVDKGSGYVKFGIRGQNVTFWARRDALFAR